MCDSSPPPLSGKNALKPRASSLSFLTFVEMALLSFGAWAYGPTLRNTFAAWNANPDYSHGFLVPLLALWFLWARREDRAKSESTPSWKGLALLVLAGLLRFAAGRFYLPELDGWSIPIWLGGIVFLFHGPKVFRWALPSLAFLWFATPLPGSLEIFLSTPLQHFAAQLGSWSLRLAGQPAIAEGTTILLNEHVLDIERACSGLRMFYGIFAFAVACVILTRLRGWGALALLLAAVPVALAANVVRIAVTGILLQSVSGEAARKFSHDFAGFVMIPFAVFLFILLVLWLRSGVERFRLHQADGVSWLIRWSLGCAAFVGALLWWGNYQQRYVLSALLDTASRYEQEHDWWNAANYFQRYLQANPSDNQARERFAEVYAKTALRHHDQLRSINFSYNAWKKNRGREDMAIDAARRAYAIGESRRSLQICEELLSVKGQGQKKRCEVQFLRADALLQHMATRPSSEYSWEDLADVLEATRTCRSNEIHYEVDLATLWQEKMSKPDQATRTKKAKDILDRLVAEHSENPMAWLARYQFFMNYGSPQDQAAFALAEKDLQQALEKVEQANKEQQTKLYLTAASFAQQHDKRDEAQRHLKRAIENSPSHPLPYLFLAELKRSRGSDEARQEAITILQNALKVVDSQEVGQLFLPLASLQVAAKEWDLAEEILGLVETQIPHFSGHRQSGLRLGAAWVRSQIVRQKKGDYPAIRDLELVLNDEKVRVHRQISPALFAKSHALLGEMYSSVGIYDRASEQYRFALQLAPEAEGVRAAAVAAALKSGDLESAELFCRQLLRETPDLSEALEARIRIHVRRQLRQPLDSRDWSRAERAYKRARDQNISQGKLLFVELELLEAQGKTNAAKQLLSQAIEQAPEDPVLRRRFAMLAEHQGEMELALQSAEQYLRLSPEEIDPYVLKAMLLEKTNRSQESQELLANLLERSTGKQWGLAAQELARLKLLLGNVGDARLLLNEISEKEPANLKVVSTLANLAWATGDWDSLEHLETRLFDIEGKKGTLWRFYRAQRLLENAESTEDPKFEEVKRISHVLQNLRPRWAKTSLLLADIALRSGQVDPAIASFQRAWSLGDRSALLADRLIELLTRQGRETEAQSYVLQVQSALALSSRLFDRAMPYFVKEENESEAVRLAEAWVARQPKDVQSHMRLGRVLMMLAGKAKKTEAYLQRAEAAFLLALKLNPEDVNIWLANVEIAGEVRGRQVLLGQLLEELYQQVDLDEYSRAFVLAQVEELLGRPLESQQYYLRAIKLASSQANEDRLVEVLGRTSQFYLGRVAYLAEHYSRAAIARAPDAIVPRQVLLQVLVQKGLQASAEEGLALLEAHPSTHLGHLDFDRRLRAKLLSQQGDATGQTQAIGLLETLLERTPEDKRLLASLYETAGRVGPALDILCQLSSSLDARPKDQVSFLRFWQQHFLTKATSSTRPPFYALAEKSYGQLQQEPLLQAEWLRWKMRAAKQRHPESQQGQELSWESVRPLIQELTEVNQQGKHWPPQAKLAWCRSLLQVLLEEGLAESALQFAGEFPLGLNKGDASVALCHAMILTSESNRYQQEVNKYLDSILTEHPLRSDLARAVGDYQLMTGQYELATYVYRKSLALEPDHKLAKNNLALSLAEIPGKLEAAKSTLQSAIEEHGLDTVLLDTRAVLELLDQRASEAIVSLKQVLAASPENATARIHVAMGYQALGQQDLMRASLFEAMSLGVNQSLLSPRDRAFFLKMSQKPFVLKSQKYLRTSQESNANAKSTMALSQ